MDDWFLFHLCDDYSLDGMISCVKGLVTSGWAYQKPLNPKEFDLVLIGHCWRWWKVGDGAKLEEAGYWGPWPGSFLLPAAVKRAAIPLPLHHEVPHTDPQ